MKTIRVVAAVICDSIEHKTKIFSTARGYGEFKGGWEFPGGKIEAGETPQQAVVREIREELDATVRVGDLIDTIEYDYPAFHLSMDCFWCEVASGELKLLEAARNVRLSEAPSHGKPITAYDRTSRGAEAYQALAVEFLKKQ